ncbi:MAG: site-2 protease family protein [Thermodesulfovibrionia bacterium]|nr:site-2 protease family protein [Thermodesulfovibrionia bacterium]
MDISNILRQLAISALPILIAITFHEVSHGFVANKLGDPTAKFLGRLTLNPIAHIDLIGTIIMPFMLFVFTGGQFVFGYAKPVPINPMNFRNPRRDMAISAAAGPITNVILAVISLLILKFLIIPASVLLPENISTSFFTPLSMMFTSSVIVNVVLAAFNLIPIPPLDGGRVLVGLLPHKHAVSYSRIEPFGFIIVVILIATGIADYFVGPLVNLFLALLRLF